MRKKESLIHYPKPHEKEKKQNYQGAFNEIQLKPSKNKSFFFVLMSY